MVSIVGQRFGLTSSGLYPYNQETICRIIEIYRFKHNWMGASATVKVPEMRLNISAVNMHERDLFD